MESIEAHSTILVLNSSYEPLNFTSWKRAIVLLFKEKAQLISKKVIRLTKFVRIPFSSRKFRPTRNMILQRDNHECQYCGSKSHLTLDHIIPRSKGGEDTLPKSQPKSIRTSKQTPVIAENNCDFASVEPKIPSAIVIEPKPKRPIYPAPICPQDTFPFT